jgi:putative membrane protein
MVASATFGPKVGQACRASFGRASALAQAFGDVVLIVASFAPNPTDDIDSATGHAAVQEARLVGARDAIFVDAHNCHEPGVGLTLFGSERSHEIIEAAKAATQAALEAPQGRIRVGYAARRGFATPDQGIGARGIDVLIVETGGQRTAYVLFDGNNMVPGIRDGIRARVAGLVQESEAMTTDNHSVNLTMDGFNAVGAALDQETILTQAEGAVREAIANLEDAEAAAFAVEIPNFRIFGPQSASRLTTSINSTMAVLRPALYVTLSGAIALGALVIVLF